ncbi:MULTISPECIES: single-stranded DNA-binding protein [Dysgonomonas]|uniref:single-stranded DNA-binding protein n=1 Tax=Dysgonomonas TaxID=156973 RepID=UPI0009286AE7|nr:MULTISPECIES: single-stranded DNA-binding protein [Dysgonomonas]MBN9301080.1 single-stranded DNA-binding protein [Dysgonomonas mossii]OJX58213.1 MAG: single-stranded DNA-binding protein [Dysgonomonas sp. 37-18]
MSINKVILVGNVGKDPDVKYFDNGSVVANFTLATTERGYTAANGTQIPDRTEWHNIVCWRGLAKVAEQFVRKGTQVYVEGKIRSRTYDDANGVKRYVNEIYADNLELLGSRKREGGDSPAGYGSPTGYGSDNIPTENTGYQAPPMMGEEDDLPF